MRACRHQPRQPDNDSQLRRSERNLFFRSCACSRLARTSIWLMLSVLALGGATAWAQSSTPATSQAQTPSAADPQNPAADLSQQKPGRVTTTVVVHGEVKDDYLSNAASAASLDSTPLRETPLSVTTVTRALMSDQISRVSLPTSSKTTHPSAKTMRPSATTATSRSADSRLISQPVCRSMA